MRGYKQDEDGTLWIRSYVANASMEMRYKIKKLLHFEKSAYQEISIVDTKGFGRVLALDGVPQVSMKEGFIYNEMISHVPLVTHPSPKKVGMIGGGDCGHVRETMKYNEIESIVVVEIDQRVTEVCREWLTPETAYANDPRIKMIHQDGYEWIQEKKATYDVLMIDRPDPEGPGIKLFKPEFYKNVFDALTDDGLAVFQSGSPYYNVNTLQRTIRHLKELFPIVKTYVVTIPLYPSGIWSFTIASKKWDPIEANLQRLQDKETKYIDADVYLASFTLPKYIR